MFGSCFRTLVIIHVSDSFRVLRPSLEKKKNEKKGGKKRTFYSLRYKTHLSACLSVCLSVCPIRISKDEAPTPLPAVGPLFIFPLLFHRSRVLLGAWRFSLFRCVYSSFHNRLDLIREPAFYWVFYFISRIYPCLFHHT